MYDYPYKILDPIHGFIRFNELEQKVINSSWFQRLRYIHQMGVAYLIYPGANHSRFEHSLGVMELASRIFDVLVASSHFLSQDECKYWRAIVRLAALCHDMGHLPFSHIAEKSLLGRKGHERMGYQILQSGAMASIQDRLGEKALSDVIKLAIDDEVLPKELSKTPLEMLFSKIITEDNFGADRIDYLLRDGYYTGVGYGHFDYHQLIDSLRILQPEKGSITMGIISSGMQSVESLWMARYLMYARVYKLPKACVYSAHMERYMSKIHFSLALTDYLEERDYTILAAMGKSGDEDAAILLKKEAPYLVVPLGEKEEWVRENMSILKQKFGEKILWEKSDLAPGSRSFWIYEEGKIVSSESYSELLQMIPLGVKSMQLFAHHDIYDEIKQFIRKN